MCIMTELYMSVRACMFVYVIKEANNKVIIYEWYNKLQY